MAVRDRLAKGFGLPFGPAAGQQAVDCDSGDGYCDHAYHESDDGCVAEAADGLGLVLGHGEGSRVPRLLREGWHG